MSYHKPVLLHQCVSQLQLQANGTYVDATFGGGGHSRLILEQLEGGKLFGFDHDPDARANALPDDRFTLIPANFRYLKKMLRLHGINQIDGLLADFGVSSHQLDAPEKGFSLRFEAELDMRMNPEKELSAQTVVNDYSAAQLAKVLKDYGEFKRPQHLANQIIAERPISTTQALKAALEKVAPRQKVHQFWARLFQAIRIEVNEEITVIKELLEQATQVLQPGGRMVCLSYHSLEDRPVKNFFKYGNFEGEPQKDFYGNLIRPLEPVNRKPIEASAEEVAQNPRARSGKLRVAQKLNPQHD
jgi:16S rRNA (cytosine1402-N4)-methyltransferase